MPTIYQLKPAFQNLLRPLVNQLAQKGVTPNQITMTALLFSILTGILLSIYAQSHWVLLLIPVILLLRMALNAIDGMLAREHDLKTPLGAILNELGDVISDTALYLPFTLISGVYAPLVVTIVILSIISEMTGVLGVINGGQRRYDGPMGKSDRAVVFSIVSLCLAFGLTPSLWLDIVWIIIIGLLLGTIFNRIYHSLKDVKSNDLDSPG